MVSTVVSSNSDRLTDVPGARLGGEDAFPHVLLTQVLADVADVKLAMLGREYSLYILGMCCHDEWLHERVRSECPSMAKKELVIEADIKWLLLHPSLQHSDEYRLLHGTIAILL